jgi:hypothetical protein
LATTKKASCEQRAFQATCEQRVLRTTCEQRTSGPTFPRYRVARTDRLVAYDRNPRTHTAAQVGLLARMITEYGWTNPILVDGKRGVIAGHGRLLAAQQLGMETVPVIELTHLTAAQKRAYVIADNASALQGGWDEELLLLELGELRDDGFNLDLTGFANRELTALFGDHDVPAEPRGSVTKRTVCPECGHAFAIP